MQLYTAVYTPLYSSMMLLQLYNCIHFYTTLYSYIHVYMHLCVRVPFPLYKGVYIAAYIYL